MVNRNMRIGVIVPVVIGIALVAVIFYAVKTTISEPYYSKDCDLLTPEYGIQSSDYIESEKTIDFADSKRVSPRGYGFKKKVIFTENTKFHMELVESMSMYKKGFVYGIYKDSLLEEPVSENRLDTAFEAAEEEEKGIIIPYEYGVDAVLEPGTYYIGIFAEQVDRTGMEELFTVNYSYIKDKGCI